MKIEKLTNLNMVQFNIIYITLSNSFLVESDWYINFFNLIQFFIYYYIKRKTSFWFKKPSKNRGIINNKQSRIKRIEIKTIIKSVILI